MTGCVYPVMKLKDAVLRLCHLLNDRTVVLLQ